jgi:hypothetical protein
MTIEPRLRPGRKPTTAATLPPAEPFTAEDYAHTSVRLQTILDRVLTTPGGVPVFSLPSRAA